jgi:ankyrin repeat protein
LPEEPLTQPSPPPQALKLLDNGADVNAAFGFDKCTPVLQAVKSNRVDVVEGLLNRNADAEATDAKGWNPILMASFHGFIDIVHLLVAKGVSTAVARPQDDFTALHLALAGNHPAVARMLVEAGANVDAPNKTGQSPLMYCRSKLLADPSYADLTRLLEGNAKVALQP